MFSYPFLFSSFLNMLAAFQLPQEKYTASSPSAVQGCSRSQRSPAEPITPICACRNQKNLKRTFLVPYVMTNPHYTFLPVSGNASIQSSELLRISRQVYFKPPFSINPGKKTAKLSEMKVRSFMKLPRQDSNLQSPVNSRLLCL